MLMESEPPVTEAERFLAPTHLISNFRLSYDATMLYLDNIQAHLTAG